MLVIQFLFLVFCIMILVVTAETKYTKIYKPLMLIEKIKTSELNLEASNLVKYSKYFEMQQTHNTELQGEFMPVT